MSKYQFISSDLPIPEFDNMQVRIIEDKDGGCVEVNSPWGEEYAIRIIEEDNLEIESAYTKKKFSNYIEWNYYDEGATDIINFIKSFFKNRGSIELWNIWLDDKSVPIKRKVCIDDLTISDIKDIWGKNYFERAGCLIVYRK